MVTTAEETIATPESSYSDTVPELGETS